MRPNASRGQQGQTTIMVLGVALVCMAVAGVTIDGTRLMLQRRQLQMSADSAALAGASELDRGAYYRSDGRSLRLDTSAAAVRSREMLRDLPRDTHAQIEARPHMMSVVLTTRIPTTFLGLVGIDSLQLVIDAEAQPVGGSI